MIIHRLAAYGAGAAVLGLLVGCSQSPVAPYPTASPGAGIAISVSARTCGSGWRDPSAGLQTFQIHNLTTAPVDVSLTNSVTGGVYAEIEAAGPGTIRPMQVDVGPGAYAFQCDSSRGTVTTGPAVVVRGGPPGGTAVIAPGVAQTLAALTSEHDYVVKGLALVVRQTAVLMADIQAGNLAAARSAWLTAHLSYERLGSAYGMFGTYDDEVDGTPAALPGGVHDPSFTGFYRIEYGLWHGQSAAELAGPARQLSHDVTSLQTAFPGMATYPQAAVSDLALRTHEILEHTIRFQLSGEDDFGSGSTLATADANIAATRAQLGMLAPILSRQYAALPDVDTSLDKLQRLIDDQQTSHGWTPASALTTTARESIDSAAAETVQLLAPIAVMLESTPLP